MMRDLDDVINESAREIAKASSDIDDMVARVKDLVAVSDNFEFSPDTIVASIALMSSAIERIHGCSPDISRTLTVAVFKLAGLVR
jgi:hypothetical protein